MLRGGTTPHRASTTSSNRLARNKQGCPLYAGALSFYVDVFILDQPLFSVANNLYRVVHDGPCSIGCSNDEGWSGRRWPDNVRGTESRKVGTATDADVQASVVETAQCAVCGERAGAKLGRFLGEYQVHVDLGAEAWEWEFERGRLLFIAGYRTLAESSFRNSLDAPERLPYCSDCAAETADDRGLHPGVTITVYAL